MVFYTLNALIESIDSHPQPEAIAQLAQEVYALDLLQLLIKKIGKLEFEARKEVTTVFNCLLRRQIGLRYPTVEYILTKPQVLFLTLDGYNDEDVSLNTGMILREMLRHEALVKLLLYDEQHFYTFPKYIETTTFGVSCDAFSNFKVCYHVSSLFLHFNFLKGMPHSSQSFSG